MLSRCKLKNLGLHWIDFYNRKKIYISGNVYDCVLRPKIVSAQFDEFEGV